LYPGIAVAQALVARDPSIHPLFLCTQRDIDATILAATPFEWVAQPIVPPRRTVGGLLRFWRAWRATQELVQKLIKEHRPAAALGLGGYAAGVSVKQAAKRKIPTAILNPDVIPGQANQYLLGHVRKVFCQFDATREHVSASHQPKLETTGCPIRLDILARPPRAQAMKRLGLDPMLQTLVVTGASQGAVTVNQAVLEAVRQLVGRSSSGGFQGWQILHLAGKENAVAVKSEYREIEVPATVVDFTPAMADVWAVAELAVSRSGASSCAELTACGVPSILMPYPFHKDQHQLANAKALVDAGAAMVITDEKDRQKNGETLRPVLESLLYDAPRRQAMAKAASAMSRNDAADRVAQALLAMIDVAPTATVN
jgi:UDP-N-acetylglucosamine--N-acetylmuramyl-(pentapeptide) pyrophosphoryl-undecaprenol N-acetylglucosamine transferase